MPAHVSEKDDAPDVPDNETEDEPRSAMEGDPGGARTGSAPIVGTAETPSSASVNISIEDGETVIHARDLSLHPKATIESSFENIIGVASVEDAETASCAKISEGFSADESREKSEEKREDAEILKEESREKEIIALGEGEGVEPQEGENAPALVQGVREEEEEEEEEEENDREIEGSHEKEASKEGEEERRGSVTEVVGETKATGGERVELPDEDNEEGKKDSEQAWEALQEHPGAGLSEKDIGEPQRSQEAFASGEIDQDERSCFERGVGEDAEATHQLEALNIEGPAPTLGEQENEEEKQGIEMEIEEADEETGCAAAAVVAVENQVESSSAPSAVAIEGRESDTYTQCDKDDEQAETMPSIPSGVLACADSLSAHEKEELGDIKSGHGEQDNEDIHVDVDSVERSDDSREPIPSYGGTEKAEEKAAEIEIERWEDDQQAPGLDEQNVTSTVYEGPRLGDNGAAPAPGTLESSISVDAAVEEMDTIAAGATSDNLHDMFLDSTLETTTTTTSALDIGHATPAADSTSRVLQDARAAELAAAVVVAESAEATHSAGMPMGSEMQGEQVVAHAQAMCASAEVAAALGFNTTLEAETTLEQSDHDMAVTMTPREETATTSSCETIDTDTTATTTTAQSAASTTTVAPETGAVPGITTTTSDGSTLATTSATTTATMAKRNSSQVTDEASARRLAVSETEQRKEKVGEEEGEEGKEKEEEEEEEEEGVEAESVSAQSASRRAAPADANTSSVVSSIVPILIIPIFGLFSIVNSFLLIFSPCFVNF